MIPINDMSAFVKYNIPKFDPKSDSYDIQKCDRILVEKELIFEDNQLFFINRQGIKVRSYWFCYNNLTRNDCFMLVLEVDNYD